MFRTHWVESIARTKTTTCCLALPSIHTLFQRQRRNQLLSRSINFFSFTGLRSYCVTGTNRHIWDTMEWNGFCGWDFAHKICKSKCFCYSIASARIVLTPRHFAMNSCSISFIGLIFILKRNFLHLLGGVAAATSLVTVVVVVVVQWFSSCHIIATSVSFVSVFEKYGIDLFQVKNFYIFFIDSEKKGQLPWICVSKFH